MVAPGVRRNALSGSGFRLNAMDGAALGSGIPDPSGRGSFMDEVKNGTTADLKNPWKGGALREVARSGNEKFVLEELLAPPGVDIIVGKKTRAFTALMKAAKHGQASDVQALLAAPGVDINAMEAASGRGSLMDEVKKGTTADLKNPVANVGRRLLEDLENPVANVGRRLLEDKLKTEWEAELNMPLQQDTLESGEVRYIPTDDKREFELNLGKAMDTLRKDYPDMLKSSPDFSIYHEDIEVVDPNGIKLHNLNRYKASFRFLHGMLNLFFDSTLSCLTFKIVYDCARKNIRVSWNAYLVPRAIYGGEGNALYLDGISVYVLDEISALITQHRVESLLLNDVPVQAPQGIFAAIRSAVEAKEVAEGVPVGI